MGLVTKISLRMRNFCAYSLEFGFRAACRIIRNNRGGEAVATINVPGIPTPISYRPGTSDFAVLRQVLGKREGDVKLANAPHLIVDAGANIGLVSLLYANKYPDATIIAIEPESENCQLFRRNCSSYKNITLIEAALWPHASTLWLSNPTGQPFSFRVGESGACSPQVRAVTMSDLLSLGRNKSIDLLKLDIEGAERELFLADADKWLPFVGTIVAELHDRFAPGCSDAFFAAVAGRSTNTYRSGEYWVVELGLQ